MGRKRRSFSVEFKCKVALEAVRERQTMAELAAEHKVLPGQITLWKKQLVESLPDVFGQRRERRQEEQDELVDRLYGQIGKLKVELDWLKKRSGLAE